MISMRLPHNNMADEILPKFTLPKTRRDLSNLNDLLVGSISQPEATVAAPVTPAAPEDSPSMMQSNERPLPRQTHLKPETSRAMLKLIIDDHLIVLTKVRAVERKTTAAAIVEEALRRYFED